MSHPVLQRIQQVAAYEEATCAGAELARILRRFRPYPPHIHTPRDGRGARHVFVDGKLVESVIYADCKRGFVVQHIRPFQLTPDRLRIRCRRLTGHVVVALA